MIDRPTYLEKLKRFRDKDLIKVTTGIRRSGKSTLYSLFIDYLKSDGVTDGQIIHIRLNDGEHDDLDTHDALYDFVKARLDPNKINYVFLDEVQMVDQFEKACLALFEKPNVDLYVTGSNSNMLSSELTTLLTGRYVEIKMLPLSFEEYVSAVGDTDLRRKYNEYITRTSFPAAIDLQELSDVRMYLDGIYSSIVLKDVVKRHKISDVASLERVNRFLYDNIGNAYSAKSISAALAESGRTVSVPTVDSYIEALKSAFMLYEAKRYDIKGKEYLKAPTKYYIPDIGLRYYLLGSQPRDDGSILENVVYLELLRREYDVAVGKVNNQEIDFVAFDKNQEPTYIQVALETTNPDTLDRELRPLKAISDSHQKLLLTLDDVPYTSFDGIKRINALDWLLKKAVDISG